MTTQSTALERLRAAVVNQYIHHPQHWDDLAKVLAVVDAATGFVDDCPVGDDDKPYHTEHTSYREFQALVSTLTALEQSP